MFVNLSTSLQRYRTNQIRNVYNRLRYVCQFRGIAQAEVGDSEAVLGRKARRKGMGRVNGGQGGGKYVSKLGRERKGMGRGKRKGGMGSVNGIFHTGTAS